MAQLSDDCFAFGGPLMSVEEALALIGERISPVAEVEDVPVHSAAGRVLAREVTALVDLPPFDNSAVDGWAVRHADLAREGETRLPVSGRVIAGSAAGAMPAVAPGTRFLLAQPVLNDTARALDAYERCASAGATDAERDFHPLDLDASADVVRRNDRGGVS